MNLLVVKANNRPADQAVSSKMYDAFIEEVTQNQNVNVTIYDVYKEDTPYIGQELFSGSVKLEAHEQLTEDEQRLFDALQKARELFSKADAIAFVFPLWNLTIPAKLQSFIDYIFSAGFTFKYDAEGNMVHLMPEKKIILLNARGGVYSAPELAPMEMAVNYMRASFGGVLGMDIIEEVIIEGHNAQPDQAANIIAEGIEKVKEVARKLGS
ncbi:FMN-dependent NADH-azoreductase [Amphibacillus sediminis]|uniref:FMN-dependent NADH-azoreductase n=1 Tax=Amphibacillus sediminis TaxID=360185 RepID=UPI00082A1881|nr:FMN-dependent NADH-azoreductase [Amphibacillus sediminis]